MGVPKRLTEMQKRFAEFLVYGGPTGPVSKSEAAELAGYSNGSHYQVVKALKDEIIDFATDVLALSAPEAAFKLVDIMKTDKPIPQIANKLQAAQAILDRVGVVKKERLDINHNVSGGVFILPAKMEKDVTVIDYTDPLVDWENEGGS